MDIHSEEVVALSAGSLLLCLTEIPSRILAPTRGLAAAIPHRILAPIQARGLAAILGRGAVIFQEEQGVVLPRSTLSFIITTLLALVAIRSQGNPEFPYQTNPRSVMAAVTCVVMYGLASAAELIMTLATDFDPDMVVGIARLGMAGSLCLFTAFLASMLYV